MLWKNMRIPKRLWSDREFVNESNELRQRRKFARDSRGCGTRTIWKKIRSGRSCYYLRRPVTPKQGVRKTCYSPQNTLALLQATCIELLGLWVEFGDDHVKHLLDKQHSNRWCFKSESSTFEINVLETLASPNSVCRSRSSSLRSIVGKAEGCRSYTRNQSLFLLLAINPTTEVVNSGETESVAKCKHSNSPVFGKRSSTSAILIDFRMASFALPLRS